MFKIKEFAKHTGFSPRMLRHLEGLGLLAPEAREENGYRVYSESQVELARAIRRLQDLGFQLKEIQELMEDESCDFEIHLERLYSRKEKETDSLTGQLKTISKTLQTARILPLSPKRFATTPTGEWLNEDRNDSELPYNRIVYGGIPIFDDIFNEVACGVTSSTGVGCHYQSFWFESTGSFFEHMPESDYYLWETRQLYSIFLCAIPHHPAQVDDQDMAGAERMKWCELLISEVQRAWREKLGLISFQPVGHSPNKTAVQEFFALRDVSIRIQFRIGAEVSSPSDHFVYLVFPYAPIHLMLKRE